MLVMQPGFLVRTSRQPHVRAMRDPIGRGAGVMKPSSAAPKAPRHGMNGQLTYERWSLEMKTITANMNPLRPAGASLVIGGQDSSDFQAEDGK